MDKYKELVNVLDAMLGPALLGALTDDEIIKDYGNLGFNIVKRGRMLLDQTEMEEKHNENRKR